MQIRCGKNNQVFILRSKNDGITWNFKKMYSSDLNSSHIGFGEAAFVQVNEGKIISLDEEGAIDYNNSSTLLRRYAPELFNRVDFTFFWVGV